MSRFKLALLSFLTFAFWFTIWQPSWSQEIVDEIIATVNGEIVTLSEFDETMEGLEPQIQVQLARLGEAERAREIARVKKQVIDELIDEKLVLQEARRFKIQVDKDDLASQVEAAYRGVKARFPNEEAFKKALNAQNVTEEELKLRYRGQIEKQLIVRELVVRKIRSKIKVTDEEIAKYYGDNRGMFSQPEEIRIRLIQISLPKGITDEEKAKKKEEIGELWAKAKSGYDFATLARQFSEGPAAKGGGDLGFFKRGALRPEFENVAFSLNVGEVSDVITTELGYHIIKLEEKKAPVSKSLDEVKDQIRESLLQKKVEEKYVQMLKDLRKEAKIEIMKEL